jgi:cytochrome c oxidase subunit IV
LCVWGLDHVLVCMGSRSCTCVYGVSIMYLCVWGLDHVLVCMGVSIMYLCLYCYKRTVLSFICVINFIKIIM